MELKINTSIAATAFRILATSLCALIPVNGFSAWTEVGPAADLTGFAIAPSNSTTLFTTADGVGSGIWKSTNSGGSWTNPIMGVDYRGIAVKPDSELEVLAGLSPGAVVRSADGGASFGMPTNSGVNNNWKFSFSSLAGTESTVYAAGLTTGGGPSTGNLVKSTNAGNSWTNYTINGDANPATYSVAVDPNDVNTAYAGVRPVPQGTVDGLYKTTNGGGTWNRLGNLALNQVDTLAISPADSRIIFAGDFFDGGNIWRSIDGGSNWEMVHDGSLGLDPLRGLAINPGNSSVIYAVGGFFASSVIISTNCGETWSSVPDPMGTITGIPVQIEVDQTGTLVYVRDNDEKLYSDTAENVGTALCPIANTVVDNSNSNSTGGNGSSGGGGSALNPIFLLILAGAVYVRRKVGVIL